MNLPPKRTITATTFARDVGDPQSRREAITGPYRDYFIAAEAKEVASLLAKQVWTIEKPNKPVTAIKGGFVYKTKELPGGYVEKVKARYCAKGYSQVEGLHYKSSFAPVASATAVRTIMYIACEYGWPLHHLDVSTAFLNADIEPDIELYIDPPPCITLKPGERLRLRKGLYGLVQGSARWAMLLAETLRRLGFKRCHSDSSVYSRDDHRGKTMMAVVVDDFCLTANSIDAVNCAKAEIKAIWDCTDFDDLDWFIKIHVQRRKSTGRMRLSQKTYIQGMVDRYLTRRGRTFTKIDTPMDPKLRLSTSMSPVSESDKLEMRRNIPFRQLLGSLQYARLTRPDAIQAISSVAKFSTNPGMPHYEAGIRVLRYLHTTQNHCLDYKSSGLAPGQPWNIEVYVDADWANDPDFRRSRSGFIIMANNNPISFGSGLQPKTSSSTPVAEYVALASAVKELIWLKQLLRELNVGVIEPVTVYEDNMYSYCKEPRFAETHPTHRNSVPCQSKLV